MRKFLLTWYGITDLRASLGFEQSDGPIAAALAAEAYTDIVVLCYTKVDDSAGESAQESEPFAQSLAAIHAAGQAKDSAACAGFIARFANTPAAHAHFIRWLKNILPATSAGAKMWMKGEKLRELNDTEGIYACAMRAMDFAAKAEGEKLVTLYLSPGTPVMAFVWSLVALAHPHLKKRLIVSPVIGKPPETINLPAEWLERHSVSQRTAHNTADGYDVVYHLFGEQRMPALLGMRQFASGRHVFVNSVDFPATCMLAFIGDGQLEQLTVDPWDAKAVHEIIVRHARSLSAARQIGINLTGGTKLMFAGALSAARALGAVPFYFDSRNRRVTFVDSLRRVAIRPVDTVETFLLLNADGLKLARAALPDPSRRLLTETLWKYRSKLASRYKDLSRIANEHDKLAKAKAAPTPFTIDCNGLVFAFSPGGLATVHGYGLALAFEHWSGYAKYLAGGWFEEYVYLQCQPYEDAGVIRDLNLNLTLQLERHPDGARGGDAEHNELDVTFTDGHSLYIVECKAGNVTQEQVMKLQNLVRFYGGVEGRGIVACCFPPSSPSVGKKIKDARLALCCGDRFPEQLGALMRGIAARAHTAGAPA